MFHISQITTVLVITASLVATASVGCTRTYTVQPVDTCNSIGANQHVSTFQLSSVNAGIINADCTNLFPGEQLCLGLQGADCDIVAVVRDGDTCTTIASAAGISFQRLLDMNPNVNSACTTITVGEVLCVSP